MVIVAGGMDHLNRPLSTVEILLLGEATRWIRLPTEMKKPRSWYPAVGVVQNRLVVAAGKVIAFIVPYDTHISHAYVNSVDQNGEGRSQDSLEQWDHSSQSWRLLAEALNWRRTDSRFVVIPAEWYPTCNLRIA